MLTLGWGLLDVRKVNGDPVPRTSSQSRRGDGVIHAQFASQPTMSRLLSILSTAKNYTRLSAAVLKLGLDHIWTRMGGQRLALPSCVMWIPCQWMRMAREQIQRAR